MGTFDSFFLPIANRLDPKQTEVFPAPQFVFPQITIYIMQLAKQAYRYVNRIYSDQISWWWRDPNENYGHFVNMYFWKFQCFLQKPALEKMINFPYTEK